MTTPSGAQRPAHLPIGRWLGDFVPLSAAEQKLVAACAKGEQCVLSAERPEKATAANTIRAGLIRFLALGGDAEHPVHEHGVCLRGAWISEALDLKGSTVAADLMLIACHIPDPIVAFGAKLAGLNLGGSAINGLIADRMTVSGGVFLRNGFSATGEVRLVGATIGGTLDCSEGSFTSENGTALNAETCIIKSGLMVKGATILGAINLGAARVGTLADGAAKSDGDAPACWGGGEHLLDGFIYDRIVGASDAKSRIAWLNTQRQTMLNAEDWTPHPWEQLIKVLREMGHPHEAAKVAIEKQRMMRKAGKIGKPARYAPADTPYTAICHLFGWMRDGVSGRVRNGLHCLSGALIGHGYDVTWAIVALIAMMGACGAAYHAGYEHGYFGPTNAVIQMHYHDQCGAPGDVVAGTGGAGLRPKKLWNDAACTPPEYTSFQPWLYSLDMILPVVNLGQDSDWAPMVANARQQNLVWGQLLRALIIVEILFGWALTLLIAAVMTNLIKKD